MRSSLRLTNFGVLTGDFCHAGVPNSIHRPLQVYPEQGEGLSCTSGNSAPHSETAVIVLKQMTFSGFITQL